LDAASLLWLLLRHGRSNAYEKGGRHQQSTKRWSPAPTSASFPPSSTALVKVLTRRRQLAEKEEGRPTRMMRLQSEGVVTELVRCRRKLAQESRVRMRATKGADRRRQYAECCEHRRDDAQMGPRRVRMSRAMSTI
jgi:hypothetical protein